MSRALFILTLLFTVMPIALAQERKNFSIDDLITGFQKQGLFYFEVLLENGKYSRAFNKCLKSKPADFKWIKENCKKNPEFKNAFQCSDAKGHTFVWFIYETEKSCEEVRKPMKDRMDAMLK